MSRLNLLQPNKILSDRSHCVFDSDQPLDMCPLFNSKHLPINLDKTQFHISMLTRKTCCFRVAVRNGLLGWGSWEVLENKWVIKQFYLWDFSHEAPWLWPGVHSCNYPSSAYLYNPLRLLLHPLPPSRTWSTGPSKVCVRGFNKSVLQISLRWLYFFLRTT